MKNKKYSKWFLLGVIGVSIAGPNATVIKYTADGVDPFFFNCLRFSVVAVVTLPFLLKDIKRFNKLNLKYAIKAGLYMSIAVISFVSAIKYSQASYVSIITLLTPIVFILYSLKLNGDKISPRAFAGITLAAIGAMVIVVLPLAIEQQGAFVFYPLATLFAFVNTLSFPLAVINYKKANEKGMPMGSLMNISALVVILVNLACLLLLTRTTQTISGSLAVGVFYSGAMVALLSRTIGIISYEHVGSASTSALEYLETLIAIIVPVMVLGERLSIEMVVGGILILMGVYVAEHHKYKHHKHAHIFRSH